MVSIYLIKNTVKNGCCEIELKFKIFFENISLKYIYFNNVKVITVTFGKLIASLL